MTVSGLNTIKEFRVLTAGNEGHAVTGVFCCDLLSIAMGKAPAGCAWVTVMGNRNTLAVAVLADVSCIILAEGACMQEEDLAQAEKEGIPVLASDLPVFETALKVHEQL